MGIATVYGHDLSGVGCKHGSEFHVMFAKNCFEPFRGDADVFSKFVLRL